MVGHEPRNPLSSLRGHAQLMKRSQTFSERSVDVIIQHDDRLERLIRDLTDGSRLEAGHLALEPAPMDLGDLVYASAEQARGQRPTATSSGWMARARRRWAPGPPTGAGRGR